MAVALVPASAGEIGVQPLDRAPLEPLVEAGEPEVAPRTRSSRISSGGAQSAPRKRSVQSAGTAAPPRVRSALASPSAASIRAAIRGSARREAA